MIAILAWFKLLKFQSQLALESISQQLVDDLSVFGDEFLELSYFTPRPLKLSKLI